MYLNGQVAEKSYSEAIRWLTSSARQGNEKAQNNLGVMYMNGLGVSRNLVEAHMWFNIAASAGDKKAKKRRFEVTEKMSKRQIENAQSAARRCVLSYYEDC
jgi:TPR repeat protein